MAPPVVTHTRTAPQLNFLPLCNIAALGVDMSVLFFERGANTTDLVRLNHADDVSSREGFPLLHKPFRDCTRLHCLGKAQKIHERQEAREGKKVSERDFGE